MEEEAKPPKKKGGRPQNPEVVDGRRPGEEPAPASAERTDAIQQEGEERSSANRKSPSADEGPVTNHDEQEKITNADQSDNAVTDK